jgi:hypothetical protein
MEVNIWIHMYNFVGCVWYQNSILYNNLKTTPYETLHIFLHGKKGNSIIFIVRLLRIKMYRTITKPLVPFILCNCFLYFYILGIIFLNRHGVAEEKFFLTVLNWGNITHWVRSGILLQNFPLCSDVEWMLTFSAPVVSICNIPWY